MPGTATERVLRERRTLLPLAGIILSLGALLLVPVAIGRQSEELRDGILERRVPIALASERFRIAAAEELAATRTFIATGDSTAAVWTAVAAGERARAFEELGTYFRDSNDLTSDAAGTLGARFRALAAVAEALPRPTEISTDARTAILADSAAIRAIWDDVSAASDRFRDGIDGAITEDTARIAEIERVGLLITIFLTALALTSAIVTFRMERQVRLFARESDNARRETQVLLESSGEGIFGLDAHGRCTFLNPAAARLIGYPEGEVLGNDLRKLLLRDGTNESPSGTFLRTTGFAGGQLRKTEDAVLIRKDGREIEVECLTSPIITGTAANGAVLTVRDVSDRRAVERERLALLRKEQALRTRAEQAERRASFLAKASELFASSLDLDTTLDSLADLIVPGIADSCVVYVVDDADEIQRLEPVHIDPERQRILAEQLDRHPPKVETLIPPVRVALTEGVSSLVHTVNVDEMKAIPGDVSHDSIIAEVGLRSLIVVPMRARGRIVGAISYGAADSGREYSEEDLAFAEDLAARAGLALDNARLYQQSQAAVMARNEVLGVVSHDLRNPLNAVRFGAQALLRHWPPVDDGEIERRQLQAITRAAGRMHRLIRDLLDLAQIDAGRLSVEPSHVQAGMILEETLEFTEPLADERNVRLTLADEAGEAVIEADAERILQVFSNLVSNAIKFSPAGGEVTLGSEIAGDRVVFRVEDRGKGIESEALPFVFDRFWKSRNGSKDGGAGLGLAIARGIVESHGGQIWVESAPDVGSTFYFALPLADTRDEAGRVGFAGD